MTLHAPELFVIDDLHPEDQAMMLALYSRSAASATTHLDKIKKTGSGKFMESYYVKYGHQSIGDCASTAIMIQNVSILAAKAIQDWPLYSGQETSTRYIDMSKQVITDPLQTPESAQILQNWMNFYLNSQEPLKIHLKAKYPRKDNESEAVYSKAIAARCFDILRAFLPAGINTQLGWHTNLRQAADKIALLNHHPDPIIRDLSVSIHTKLKERYPHSFSHKLYDKTETYRAAMVEKYTYFDDIHQADINNSNVICSTTICPEDLEPYMDAIKTRPPKTELPTFLLDLGLVTFDFLIDFGSFRDVQRHRNGVCRMPLLTTKYGFEKWYLDQLPESLRNEAQTLIDKQIKAMGCLVKSDQTDQNNAIISQYYTALGFRVPCHVSYGLPAALYTIELRSGVTVHSTLRVIAHKMMHALKEKLPNLVFHVDLDADEWDIRRGLQDIVAKTH